MLQVQSRIKVEPWNGSASIGIQVVGATESGAVRFRNATEDNAEVPISAEVFVWTRRIELAQLVLAILIQMLVLLL